MENAVHPGNHGRCAGPAALQAAEVFIAQAGRLYAAQLRALQLVRIVQVVQAQRAEIPPPGAAVRAAAIGCRFSHKRIVGFCARSEQTGNPNPPLGNLPNKPPQGVS